MRNRRNFILQALYSVIYKITYNLNGGTLSKANPTEYTIPTSEFILNTPTREGFTFLGWTLNNEKTYSTPKFGDYGDKHYTAHWNMNLTTEDYSSNIDPSTLIVEASNDLNEDGVFDDYSISMKCASYMEKVNLPLNNLIPGQKYNLCFTETNNATPGNTEAGYARTAYGCYVNETKYNGYSASDKEILKAQNGLIAEWSTTAKSIVAIDGKNFNGPRDMNVSFTATKNPMYWIWDFGGIADGIIFNFNFNNIVLKPVAPKIKLSSIALKDTAPYAILNVKEVNDTNLKITYEFDGESGVEFLYLPITGLVPGAKYNITFNHKFKGAFINGDNGTYEYGCGIVTDVESVGLTSKMSTMTSKWLSNVWTMNVVSNDTEQITLSFTPTTETVYWIWNMANVSDGTIATITLNVIDFNVSSNNITYQFI